MPLPKLEIGLIVQYEYLWHRRRSAPTADKDHPACVVMTFRRPRSQREAPISAPSDPLSPEPWDDYVVYLPISHAPPGPGQEGIKLPADVRRKAGLDDRPQWVLISECNIDVWPEDLRQLPGHPGRFHYGVMPPGIFIRIRDAFVARYRAKRVSSVKRP